MIRIAIATVLWLVSALTLAAPQDDVAAVLDQFHAAAANADLEAYQARMTDDMVFLGTDASERWQGADFVDFARPHFASGKGWTYIPQNRRIQVDRERGLAWFDELLDNAKLGLCRGTGVLLRQPDGTWKIAQYNLSMPVPNAMIEGVAEAIQGGESPPLVSSGPAPDSSKPSASSDEASTESRGSCRKRHKTNSRADC